MLHAEPLELRPEALGLLHAEQGGPCVHGQAVRYDDGVRCRRWEVWYGKGSGGGMGVARMPRSARHGADGTQQGGGGTL